MTTPEDLALDTDLLFAHQPLTLYRLARTRYANLSGVGAALYPGRWNRSGQEAIYTSTEKSTPVLERLVHTPKDLIPSNLAMMKIRISCADWTLSEQDIWTVLDMGTVLSDKQTGASMHVYRTLAAARARIPIDIAPDMPDYIMKPLAIALPSVIVPVWNVVLFPAGRGFWDHVALETVEPFEFDPRLFPDNTPVETPE